MIFNRHSHLEGQHALLSASKYHWINYDEDQLINFVNRHKASQRGTELHIFACQAIRLGIKMPKTRSTLNLYVNDGIGFKMETEQILYYSDNCFGTADTISFRKNILRIHDYKSGVRPASMSQLEVYAALFCLEYDVKPIDISMELRLYQLDDVVVAIPEPEKIFNIMNKIVAFDRKIDELRSEG